jgi:acetyl/propionyl-CoA carboxylase alpha subunit
VTQRRHFADTESLRLRLSDERVLIGPPLSTQSYLNIENIATAARLK